MRLALVALFLIVAPAIAGELVVIDGDTFALATGERVRILGIDAAELRGNKCERAAELAFRAAVRLVEIFATCPPVLERHGEDRDGRTLANVSACGRDVGESLIAEGLARKWTGRRESWC